VTDNSPSAVPNSEALQAKFDALIDAPNPTEKLLFALGKELARPPYLLDDLYGLVDESEINLRPICALVYTAARVHDDRLSAEKKAELKDLAHLRKLLADITQNNKWPQQRGYLVEFSKRVMAKLDAKTRRHSKHSAELKGTIWFHQKRQYSIDRINPWKVSREFDSILQAFLQAEGAMETSDIQDKAGVTNVSRAMKSLAAWHNSIFKPAIRIPEGKAKGGYFIHVKKL
jgi:hypothetical protein